MNSQPPNLPILPATTEALLVLHGRMHRDIGEALMVLTTARILSGGQDPREEAKRTAQITALLEVDAHLTRIFRPSDVVHTGRRKRRFASQYSVSSGGYDGDPMDYEPSSTNTLPLVPNTEGETNTTGATPSIPDLLELRPETFAARAIQQGVAAAQAGIANVTLPFRLLAIDAAEKNGMTALAKRLRDDLVREGVLPPEVRTPEEVATDNPCLVCGVSLAAPYTLCAKCEAERKALNPPPDYDTDDTLDGPYHKRLDLDEEFEDA